MALTVLLIACLAIVTIQVIYIIVFLVAFAGERRQPVTQQPVGVSVIICAHDEEQNLRTLLPALLAQEHSEFEVIVVDDRSNDGTFDYLLQMSTAHPKIRMVPIRETPRYMNGKKFALTMGIKAAKYDWVLLTDSDCRPAAHWISGMAQHFLPTRNIVIGFSPYQKSDGLLNAFIRFEAHLTAIQYIGMALLGKPYMGVGRNLAYQKKLFLESKGFNGHLEVQGGDDDLFVNRHARKETVGIAIGSQVVVHSIPKQRWREFYVQKLRHLSVGKRYRAGDRVLLGMFTLSWILTTWSLAALPFLGANAAILGGAVVLRWFLLSALFQVAARRLGEPFESWKVPFLDFIYAFYYLVAGPMALVSKRVRWKI